MATHLLRCCYSRKYQDQRGDDWRIRWATGFSVRHWRRIVTEGQETGNRRSRCEAKNIRLVWRAYDATTIARGRGFMSAF
jgi:hypothetical protein